MASGAMIGRAGRTGGEDEPPERHPDGAVGRGSGQTEGQPTPAVQSVADGFDMIVRQPKPCPAHPGAGRAERAPQNRGVQFP